MATGRNKHSIEVANRSPIEKGSKSRGPANLEPTYQVIGEFQTPLEVVDNQPDMAMIQQVRELLNYRSNITVLEWWRIFPVRRWWAFAIQATKHLARTPNYKYFLLSLVTAARGGEKFQQYQGLLKRILGQIAGQIARQQPVRPVCDCSGGCERCYPLLLQYQEELTKWQRQRWAVQGESL